MKLQKTLGARTYRNHSKKTLEETLLAVVEGRLNLSKASKVYNIPIGTFHNKYPGKHVHKPGGKTALSDASRKVLLKNSPSAETEASHYLS